MPNQSKGTFPSDTKKKSKRLHGNSVKKWERSEQQQKEEKKEETEAEQEETGKEGEKSTQTEQPEGSNEQK